MAGACRAVYKQGPMTTLFMVHSTPVRPGVSKQLFRRAAANRGGPSEHAMARYMSLSLRVRWWEFISIQRLVMQAG